MKVKQFELTGKCNLKCNFCYNQNNMLSWKEMERDFVIAKNRTALIKSGRYYTPCSA